MTQVSIGLALDLGKSTLVLALNSPVSVEVPKNFEVRIAPLLLEQGIKVLGNGKIKFPGKAAIAGLIITDYEFEMVRVIVPTQATLIAASLDMKDQMNASGIWGKLEKFLKMIPDESLTANLVERLFTIDPAPLKAFWAQTQAVLTGVDFEAVVNELADLAQQYEESLPGSALDSED